MYAARKLETAIAMRMSRTIAATKPLLIGLPTPHHHDDRATS
jgi:hypothetical protein